MRILIAFILIAASLPAASWIVNTPEVLSKFQEKSGDRLLTRVRVAFRDDSTPQKTIEKEYLLGAIDALSQLRRLIYQDQQELQAGEAITAGSITPLAPTPTEAAILTYQEASRRVDALNKLVARMGWTEASIVWGTRTVAQIRSSLRNAVQADMTSDERVTVALDNTF